METIAMHYISNGANGVCAAICYHQSQISSPHFNADDSKYELVNV